MALRPKIIEVRFYATASGAEPVRDWLKEMDQDDRRAIGADIATVEHGWPVGRSARGFGKCVQTWKAGASRASSSLS